MFGIDWMALDPPRHLHVHSVESLRRLAADAGLRLQAVEFDSTEFQFVASEQYRRDIPLLEQRPPPRSERARFRRLARRLNDEHRGDQAAFYFRRA